MRELGDLRQTAFLLAYLAGAVGIGGDPARGEALIAESEQLLESLGDTSSFEANFVTLIQGWLALTRRRFQPRRGTARSGAYPGPGTRREGDPLGHARLHG